MAKSKSLDPIAVPDLVEFILDRANTLRLLEDARLLFEAKRYPSAVQMAIIAIEESEKEAILRFLAATGIDDEAEVSMERLPWLQRHALSQPRPPITRQEIEISARHERLL
jgi:hypothetical protein